MDVDIRQKAHFYFQAAVAFACLAAAAFDIEGETTGTVAPGTGFRNQGKELADIG